MPSSNTPAFLAETQDSLLSRIWRITKRKDRFVWIMALVMIATPSTLFAVFLLPYLTTHISIAIPVFFAYFVALSLATLFRTSYMDPGYLPQNLRLDLTRYPGTQETPSQQQPPQQQQQSSSSQQALHAPNNAVSLSTQIKRVNPEDPINPNSLPELVPTNTNVSTSTAQTISTIPQQQSSDPALLSSPQTIHSKDLNTSPSSITTPLVPQAQPSPVYQQEQPQQPAGPGSTSSQTYSNTSSLPSGYPFVNRPAIEYVPPDKVTMINGRASLKLRFCSTCKIFRPPRASHCSSCDRCVEFHDHHCPWMANCVGKRNYRYFYLFVTSTSILAIYVFALSIAMLIRIQNDRADPITGAKPSFFQVMGDYPVNIVLILYTFFLSWSIIGLSTYHTWLSCRNMTTHEQLRSETNSWRTYDSSAQQQQGVRRLQYSEIFSHGNIFKNFLWVMFRSRSVSTDLYNYIPSRNSRSHADNFLHIGSSQSVLNTDLEERVNAFRWYKDDPKFFADKLAILKRVDVVSGSHHGMEETELRQMN